MKTQSIYIAAALAATSMAAIARRHLDVDDEIESYETAELIENYSHEVNIADHLDTAMGMQQLTVF